MSEFLEKVISSKIKRLELQRQKFPVKEMEKLLANAPPVRDIFSFLLKDAPGQIPVIAEIKRKSPSAGAIKLDLNPGELARSYELAGARAVSVLCEEDFFAGSLEDLQEVKKACGVPVLCKDFIISSFQIIQARISGADLTLLIVSALDSGKLKELYILSKELMMTPLVEVHNQAELEIALSLGARLIGINNRNLKTLEVNLDTTKKLLPLIPKDRVVISESGFKSRAELEEFQALGVSGFLIGGSILSSENPEKKLRELVYGQG